MKNFASIYEFILTTLKTCKGNLSRAIPGPGKLIAMIISNF